MQGGGGRHLEKSKNRHISPTVGPIATKFGTLAQFDLPDHTVWKIDPSSCTFSLVYALDVLCSFSKAFAVQNDEIACLNLAIKQQIYMLKLQFIHIANGDGSKTAKIIKRHY